MNNSPKISIIMPVYNVEKYISECMDSVLNQTLKEIEVLCVDDGSTDSSPAIMQMYAEKDSRVRVFSQQNRGAGIARNTGLNFAKGRYIAFMDPDDIYPSLDCLEKLYTAADNNNALICGGSVEFLKNDKVEPGVLRGEKYYFSKEGWVTYSDFQQDYYYQRFLFDREMLKKNNLSFPYYKRYQDPPFFVKAMATAQQFYAIPDFVYTYRVGFSNIKWTAEKIYDRMEGVIEELQISRDFELNKIHKEVANRLKAGFDTAIENYTVVDAGRMLETFYRGTAAIDPKVANVNMDYIEKFWSEDVYNLETAQEETKSTTAVVSGGGAEKAKISIVIPSYNSAEFLNQCIDSVINQDFKDIEIICVNDGSKDNTAQIFDSYRKNDDRFTIISFEKNGGLSNARNAGIKIAKGKYILFLDSDDLYAADTLSTLYNKAETNDLDLLLFSAETFYETEELRKRLMKQDDYYYRKGYLNFVSAGNELLELQVKSNQFRSSACMQMFSVDLLRNNNIEFYSGILHEDELFSPLVMAKAQRAMCIEDRFYLRRMRDDSIMTKAYTHRNFEGYFIAYVELMNAYMAGGKKDNGLLMRAMAMYNTSSYRYKELSAEERAKILVTYPEVYQFIYSKCNYESLISGVNTGLLKFIKAKIKGGIQCYKDNGLKYTIHRAFSKVFKLFRR